jgi:hypothetical protein
MMGRNVATYKFALAASLIELSSKANEFIPQSLKGKDFLCLISFLLSRLRARVRVRTSLGGRPGGGRGASGTFDPPRLWAGR